MTRRRENLGLQTWLVHGGQAENDSPAVSPPIYQTSTFRLHSAEEGARLSSATAPATFYTRYGNPNNKQVELVLAELEGAEAALVLASGAAAVAAAIISTVRAGDHVVAQQTHYTATLSLLSETLPRFGVEVTQVDQRDPEAFARAMRPNTRVVYTETPTNPTMDLTDLRATAEIAHAAGALAITDNTFASSYNQRPLELGYDLVVHSATKFLNGHADVTAGALMGPQSLIDQAWEYLRVQGAVLHPFDSWLLLRGLHTYALRMEVHNRSALQVARFLEQHPAVERVFYPGLESHPQYELARRQMVGGFGGLLSFEIKGGYQAAYTALSRIRVCTLAVSLGGIESLIIHPASMIYTYQDEEALLQAGILPGLIRLSVGIENVEDIIADLDQAMSG